MFTLKRNCDLNAVERAFKVLLLCLFYILPSRVTRMFFEISVTILLIKLRTNTLNKDGEFMDEQKFTKLMKLAYKDEIVDLPNYTLTWFWSDSFLNKEIHIEDKNYKISTVMKDNEILKDNLEPVVSELVEHLPLIVRNKLKLDRTSNTKSFKNDLKDIFEAGMVYC